MTGGRPKASCIAAKGHVGVGLWRLLADEFIDDLEMSQKERGRVLREAGILLKALDEQLAQEMGGEQRASCHQQRSKHAISQIGSIEGVMKERRDPSSLRTEGQQKAYGSSRYIDQTRQE
ncbi:hypothetical protein J3459_015947 [Metarhizium acridum]|nr:hypothetical protein J3459_015947 [Metarhizium acridum]